MKESQIQRQILDYLKLRHIFHHKVNNVGIRKPNGSYIPAPALGVPDILCCVNGLYVGLEVKQPRGIQSEHQKAFQKALIAAGGAYFLVRSLDEAIEAIEDAMRRTQPHRLLKAA